MTRSEKILNHIEMLQGKLRKARTQLFIEVTRRKRDKKRNVRGRD